MNKSRTMEMGVTERIDGNRLVMKSFLLSVIGLVGILLGVMMEKAGGFIGKIGMIIGLIVLIGYIVGVVMIYSKAGVWGFIGSMAIKGLALPWRITKIIVFT